jgi:alkaline phosphatase D
MILDAIGWGGDHPIRGTAVKPSRRDVLAGIPAIAALSACPVTPEPEPEPFWDPCGPEPAAWEAPGAEDVEAFAWGVQVTDATPDGALVSVRTTAPGPLSLRLASTCDGAWEELDGVDELVPNDGGVAQVELVGLEPDTVHNLAIYGPDGQARSQVTRFRTALAADASRTIRFGASSCMGGPGWPWVNMTNVSREDLDFFCLLGDTVYADGDDDVEDYRVTWGVALSGQGMKDLSGRTSFVHTWDDHEVDNNYSWENVGFAERFAAATQVFGESLPWRPGPGPVEGARLWRKLSWGRAADVFVLDCRSERLDGHYISPAQMDWFKAELAASQARFKIVLNSVPITDLEPLLEEIQLEDRWSGFPDQRDEILSFVQDEGIEGVLWLSGDLHYGQVGLVGQAGALGAADWEVLVGPSGSQINPWPGIVAQGPAYDELQEQYPVLLSARTSCLFELDPEIGTVRVRFVDDDDVVLAEMTFDL